MIYFKMIIFMKSISSSFSSHFALRTSHLSLLGFLCVFFVCSVVIPLRLWAADTTAVDENALFADTSSITKSAEVVDNKLIQDQTADKKSVGFSGEITSAAIGNANRDWFDNFRKNDLSLAAFMVGNLFLDIRQPQGTKAFVNVETQYQSATSQMQVDLRELFIDWNIRHHVYFRAGKQVLQWGRCYFWNPTDLINVEKKLFIQKIGYREGTYGLKIHVPFGTTWNIYSFLDAKDASSVDSLAIDGKVEFLAGKTEMALSVWGKDKFHPVYGFDISSRVFLVDISGEISLASTDNYRFMQVTGDTLLTDRRGDRVWKPRAALGLSQSFAVSGVADRLGLTGEFYYNGYAYNDNAFADQRTYKFQTPIPVTGPNGLPAPLTAGTKSAFLQGLNLYEVNSYSKYYLALFTTFGQFIINDMTLTANAIGNLEQKSMVVSTGVSYSTLSEFTTGLTISAFLGPQNTEYTFSKNALSVQATAGITF